MTDGDVLHNRSKTHAIVPPERNRTITDVSRAGRFFLTFCLISAASAALGDGGSLTISAEEESSGEPTITRLEIWRGPPQGKPIGVRRTVPSGMGVVLDRSLIFSMPENNYTFRVIRGPEYRIITGNFALEKTSLDDHTVRLPRMVDMLAEGWTSGDCCVVASKNSLPLRMASEDLHVAAVLGHVDANPIPHRQKDDPIAHEPSWIREDATHHGGLLFYGDIEVNSERLPVETVAKAIRDDSDVRIAIENPFAWPLPVWLASKRIDGAFVLGDWLRLDRRVMSSPDRGRPPDRPGLGDGQLVGRWGEVIYRHMLDAGLRIPPLAGGGNDSALTPVGYNRLYVGWPLSLSGSRGDQQVTPVASSDQWWEAAWKGHSVATNGPMLRPQLGGEIPGHVFTAASGEVLKLQPELTLAVRDKVEYLEVIKNGKVFYSARLKEFAKAGGVMPIMTVNESSWVIMRVVTLHEDHYRAAVSAPWYIDFDGRQRVGKESVAFFQKWLAEYEQRLKKLPPAELKRHVPFVKAARAFWAEKAARVTN